jgi:hypothetical protein
MDAIWLATGKYSWYAAPQIYPGWVTYPGQWPYHPVGARSDILLWPLGIITYSGNLRPPTLGDIVGLDPMLLTNPGRISGCGIVPVGPTRPPILYTPSPLEQELASHCLGNPQALRELTTLLITSRNTSSSYGWYGFCGGWLSNFCANLPATFREGTTALKVTPVWLFQGDPSLGSGYLTALSGVLAYLRGAGYDPPPGGHFAARVEFPDGYVAYFDNGWAGTGGIFTFHAGGRILCPKVFMHSPTPTMPPEPGWPK